MYLSCSHEKNHCVQCGDCDENVRFCSEKCALKHVGQCSFGKRVGAEITPNHLKTASEVDLTQMINLVGPVSVSTFTWGNAKWFLFGDIHTAPPPIPHNGSFADIVLLEGEQLLFTGRAARYVDITRLMFAMFTHCKNRGLRADLFLETPLLMKPEKMRLIKVEPNKVYLRKIAAIFNDCFFIHSLPSLAKPCFFYSANSISHD